VIAWVLGASGTWGGAVARDLLGRGYDVVALGRHDAPAIAAAAAGIGRAWSFVELDLAKLDGAVVAAATVEAMVGGVPDILVVCSAATGLDREASVRANYLAPATVVTEVLREMLARGSGRIGLFVGQNARLGLAGLADFSAAQGALWTWCEATRGGLDAAGRGVTLTRVIPPRAASATQRWVADRSGHTARLHEPRAHDLVGAIMAGRRHAGRRPTLAALALLFR
jgi:NAD(P)-dependent dehydrogenase (short-subunit alcohol dehydrogenase family)